MRLILESSGADICAKTHVQSLDAAIFLYTTHSRALEATYSCYKEQIFVDHICSVFFIGVKIVTVESTFYI